MHVVDTIGTRELKLGHGNSYARITTDDASKPLDLQINAQNALRVQTNKDVSIGTDTSQGKLTVVGTTQTIVSDLTANAEVGLSIMGLHTSNKVGITIGKANSSKNSGVFRYVHSSLIVTGKLLFV